MSSAFDKMEKGILEHGVPNKEQSLASIAISLKRIADAVEEENPPKERVRIAAILWDIKEALWSKCG